MKKYNWYKLVNRLFIALFIISILCIIYLSVPQKTKMDHTAQDVPLDDTIAPLSFLTLSNTQINESRQHLTPYILQNQSS